jgi:hypothetical protein
MNVGTRGKIESVGRVRYAQIRLSVSKWPNREAVVALESGLSIT